MDSVALALFRFFSRTRQKAGAAVRAPGAAPHPHPHPHECNYAVAWAAIKFHWTNKYSWLITVLTNFDSSLSLVTQGLPMKSGLSG